MFSSGMRSFPPLFQNVKKLILQEQLIKKDELVIVAVSGGADSLSLLVLLNRLRQKSDLAFSLHVAHLDHGLRGKESLRDAQFVRREAEKLGLPCTVGRVKAGIFKEKWGLSLEDAARRLRYRFLLQLAAKLKAGCIAVGHNRDDQVETLLLNLLRGTGPEGLAGMQLTREAGVKGCRIIRPLLYSRRKEIESFCREAALSPRFDRTNLDRHFLRNKVRLDILPLLEKKINPSLREGLFRLSLLLSQDKDFWQKLSQERLEACILEETNKGLLLDRRGLVLEHEALQGRILRRAVERFLGYIPGELNYHRLKAALHLIREDKPRGAVPLPGGIELTRNYQTLALRRIISGKEKVPERFLPVCLPLPGEVSVGREGLTLAARLFRPEELAWPPDERKEAYLDYDRVLELAGKNAFLGDRRQKAFVLVRVRQPGDRFFPLGAPGEKKLKDFFIDRKIPWEQRDTILLVVAGEEIIWIAGYEISHLCRVTAATKRVVVFSLEGAWTANAADEKNPGRISK